MPIKPVDVRRKEFGRGFRGYNADQVDDFLDSVADEYERSYTDNARLREEISNLRERLEQFERLEDSIRAALVRAEQAAEEMKKSASREAESLTSAANREAELTLKDARDRSQKMLADSSSKLAEAQESYEALRKAKTTFASDFRHLLKAYMDVMDNMDVMSARDIESSLRERFHPEAVEAVREAADRQENTSPPEQEENHREIAENKDQPRQPASSPEAQRTDELEAAEPEVTEPEFEPSSSETDAGQATVETETEAVEEVEREEPSPAADSAADDFWEDAGGRKGSTAEGGNRIFRASRFLRRRG